MVQISSDYIMTEGKRVNIYLGQNRRFILLSIPCEYKLFPFLFSEWDREEHICQISDHIPCT